MRPLKIALLSSWYWEENRRHDNEAEGGATRQLAEAVAALGHEVVVLSQSARCKRLKKAQIGPLETWLSPRDQAAQSFSPPCATNGSKKTYSHRKVYSDALALRDFLARRGPFDVLWAHTEAPDGLVVAIAAQLGVKLPPVLRPGAGPALTIRKGRADLHRETSARPRLSPGRRASWPIPRWSPTFAPNMPARAIPPRTSRPRSTWFIPIFSALFFTRRRRARRLPGPMKDRVLFLGAINQAKGALVFLNALPKTEASKRSSIFAVIGDFTEHNKRFIQRWEETKEATRIQTLGARMEYLGQRQHLRGDSADQAGPRRRHSLALRRLLARAGRVAHSRPARHHHRPGRRGPAGPGRTSAGSSSRRNDPDSLARAIDVILSPDRALRRERPAPRPAPAPRILARSHRPPGRASSLRNRRLILDGLERIFLDED